MKLFSRTSNTPRSTAIAITATPDARSSVETALATLKDVSPTFKHSDDALGEAGRLVNGSADIVILEADLSDTRAIPAIETLCAYVGISGALVVLAHGANAGDMRDMFRMGVGDVLTMPIGASDISAAISTLLGQPRRRDTRRTAGRVVSLLKCGGGAGATMLATHMAANISARRKMVSGNAPRTLVIDLDLQFGSVASAMAAEGRVSMLDLIKAKDRLDPTLLASATRNVRPDFDIIAAPDGILPLSALSPDQLKLIIDTARAQYDYILLDHPQNWSGFTATALDGSDAVIAVMAPRVEHANAAVAMMEGLDNLRVPRDRILVVHNGVDGMAHTDRIKGIDALTRRPSVSIPRDTRLHESARDQGKLLGEMSGSRNQIKAITRTVDRMFEMINSVGGRMDANAVDASAIANANTQGTGPSLTAR